MPYSEGLLALVEAVPCAIRTMLTDNGVQFAYTLEFTWQAWTKEPDGFRVGSLHRTPGLNS